MKLSIIIPVFQTEKTLERCVESVLNQSFRDYQLILVDDGSPDDCPALCDALVKRDKRVQVIHKSNGGLSDARNAGLRRAKGEYVMFIDSDDYIAADTLKRLMDILAVHHDYDLLEYSVYEHYGRPRKMNMLQLDNREYTDMRQYWYEAAAYRHTYAWNKVYRRELFRDVLFPVGRKFEDAFTLPQLLQKCQVVATTGEGYYYYCYNPAGITAQASGSDLKDLLEAHLLVLNGDGSSLLQPVTADYYAQVLNIALDVFELTGEAPTLPPYKPQKVQTGGSPTLKMRLLSMIGMRNLCRLNKFLRPLRRH